MTTKESVKGINSQGQNTREETAADVGYHLNDGTQEVAAYTESDWVEQRKLLAHTALNTSKLRAWRPQASVTKEMRLRRGLVSACARSGQTRGQLPSVVTRGYSLEGLWTWGSRHHCGEGKGVKVLLQPTGLPTLEMRTVPGESDKAKRKTS